ncbi:hypothetical protein SAMN04488121_107327 [Chitinophaga filiformis]|uniref:Uncharacterized protein n=1 Tax=Chitinophaga filiformis TaxID=104663 RepID=A0A1G7YFM1_CHIFI|nr:hypothetical protein SAMN04488121_107327 [Chitinophaga filiformis]
MLLPGIRIVLNRGDESVLKKDVSKINEGPRNRLNSYLSPSGIRMKQGYIKSMIHPCFIAEMIFYCLVKCFVFLALMIIGLTPMSSPLSLSQRPADADPTPQSHSHLSSAMAQDNIVFSADRSPSNDPGYAHLPIPCLS